MIPENGKSFELFGLIVRAPNCEELHEEVISENVVGGVVDQYHRQYGDDDQIISVQESFDEMVSDRPSENKRTLVVLDCANIGWAHGGDHFSAAGIQIAINFFSNYKVDIVAFIPSNYLRKKPRDGARGNSCMETDDWDILNTLVHTGKVTVVPAGDHDDVYILSYARFNNGFVVSNDFFVDHIKNITEETIRTSMKYWLNENRCGYTFHSSLLTFMINPGNILSTVLGYLNFQEKKSEFEENFSTVISSLSSSISVLLRCERYVELKYLLLARSSTYMEIMLLDEALNDLYLILIKIDPNCSDALAKIQQCRTMQQR
mmetsp:Transcript_21436/g.20732  ORF Transcript_21436/g.20732 Transcript_21436/m.20732 type:complete len:318 (+) Transcript_21436:124-1077(+)